MSVAVDLPYWAQSLLRVLGGTVAVLLPAGTIVYVFLFKMMSFMQSRLGPMEAGPYGSMQLFAEVGKWLQKEDIQPARADKRIFKMAPLIVLVSTFLLVAVVPFGPDAYFTNFDAGVFYMLAVSSISVLGILVAGWSSFNKYSLLGGIRSAAQVISYEVPLTLSVVGLLILAQTMSLNQLVLNQAGWFTDWYVWQQPLGFLVFFIAATAEANRTPFDLTEADSEIVAGFATEYSGMRFGFFFFAEYVNVFIVSALTVTLFFGGWNAPFPFPAITLPVDLGSMGLLLLILVAVVPLVGTLVLAAPFYLLRSSMPAWQALIIGFVLFNIVAVAAVLGWAFVSLEWVAGLLWFMKKTYAFVFLFVWMRGTLPRVRIDQLMGFAWKWLLPASLLNLFVTAAAVLVIREMGA